VSLHRAFACLAVRNLDPIQCVGELRNLRIHGESLQTFTGSPKPTTGNSTENVLIFTS